MEVMMTLLACALLFTGLAHAEGDEVHPDKPSGLAFGVTAGVATGLGASVRIPFGEKTRVLLTAYPVYTRDSTFFSGGVRLQRTVAFFDHVRVHTSLSGAMHTSRYETTRAAGLGFGMETGGRYSRGFTWWGDLAYTAVFDSDGLAMIAPLPQTGLLIAF